ncbi:unnamed protein product [Mesocestoides corti]|uniref:BHLH domain-containing protein n=1 Tax=Mesocestoides corti TaxID=53468 RepID=A0A0R3UF29_MESCO|nr:unnamed protein product [Mesocestoides corti]
MELLGVASNQNRKPQSPPPPSHRGEKDFRIPIKHVANARERTRTASVNDAFVMLRRLIPTEPLNRKLSKIEILRLATSYISHLNSILATGIPAPEQPCLRHLKTACGGQRQQQRPAICTFCMNEFKQHQKELETQK